MGRTLRALLEDSLYLSIADREFSPIEPDGSQINVALNTFIKIIDAHRYDVPFYEEKLFTVDTLSGVGFAEVIFVQYFLGNAPFLLERMDLIGFRRQEGIKNLKAPPAFYYFDENTGTILLYPMPSNPNDEVRVGYRPLFSLNNLDAPLPIEFKALYQEPIEYEIASRLCDQYSRPWSAEKEASRQKAWNRLRIVKENALSASPKDTIGGSSYNAPFPWFYYLSTGGTL